MIMQIERFGAGLGVVLFAAPLGCLDPTEALVEISTDACADLHSTGITAGLVGDIETAPYGTTTSVCEGQGEIGSIVLLPPEGEREAPFAFKVVGSLGLPVAETCKAPEYGPRCIVARRAMRFVPHNPFRIPVHLSQACAGVLCPEAQTCVDGTCRSATVDPVDCESDADCGPVAGIPPPWQKHLGGPGFQMARHLALGGDGTLVLTGHFDGSINLGGSSPRTSKGGKDVFIASYSQGGHHRWSASFGAEEDEDVTRAAIDAEGSIYVLAQFRGKVNFGGGPLVSAGSSDIAILKFKTFGQLEWSVRFGGPLADAPGAIAVGADGTIYVTGNFSDFAGTGSTTISANGPADAFILSLTPAGKVRWAKVIGGPGDDGGTGVGVDAAGNVYVAGYFEDAVDFGLPAPAMPSQAQGSDAFVNSYDAQGGLRWVRTLSGGGTDRVHDLAVRGDRVAIAGRITNDTLIGGQAFNTFQRLGLVAAFDTNGALAWGQTFGGENNGTGQNVAIAEDETVVVSGDIGVGSVFGKNAGLATGHLHPFVGIVEPDGKPRWAKVFPSSNYATATGVAAPAHGHALIAGWFDGELKVGAEKMKSEGIADGFLLRVAPP